MSDLALQLIRENIEAHARGEDATYLDLGKCGMTEVPEEIRECVWLEKLTLSGTWYEHRQGSWIVTSTNNKGKSNSINSLPKSLSSLSKLKVLILSGNPIIDLSPISGLNNLYALWLSRTLVHDLSPIAALHNLQIIVCHTTKIIELHPLAGLPNLKHLRCASNSISDLSPLLPLIKSGIPIRWAKYDEGICIQNCPLTNPPLEIVQQGNAAVLRYFEDLETQGEEIVYEAKMLILGDAGAGKTSLARKIENPDAEMPDEEKDSTPGIAVRSLLLAGQPDFTMHIWDFGGQEVYHATHQFFLSKRSLYILLADGRKEEQLDYWLQMQEIYGQDSRLLIVVNQKADMQPSLPMSDIRRDYPNVQEAQPTIINLKTDRDGAIALRQRIERNVRNLPQFEQGLRTPKKWAAIRRQLEALEAAHILISDYRGRCAAEGIIEKIRQDDLLDFLHHLGAVLHFKDVAGLNKMVILRPEWATGAVYRLLDHTRKKGSDGHFSRSDLDAVWQCAEYEDYFEELLLLMEKFELCYPAPEQKRLYIVPSLLPDNAPEIYAWPAAATDLQLSYEYSFMPKGIVTRLIVRQHALLKQPPVVWKRGAVFAMEGASAEVVESYRDKRISIRATGRAAKSLLTLLARDLDVLNQGFHFNERMTLRAMVPCNCTTCEKAEKAHRFEYGNLLYRLQNGRNTIECYKSFQPVNISDLLRETFSDVDAILRDIERQAKAKQHSMTGEG